MRLILFGVPKNSYPYYLETFNVIVTVTVIYIIEFFLGQNGGEQSEKILFYLIAEYFKHFSYTPRKFKPKNVFYHMAQVLKAWNSNDH